LDKTWQLALPSHELEGLQRLGGYTISTLRPSGHKHPRQLNTLKIFPSGYSLASAGVCLPVKIIGKSYMQHDQDFGDMPNLVIYHWFSRWIRWLHISTNHQHVNILTVA